MDIASEKAALRQAVGRRSALLSPNYRQRASAAICKRLLALPELWRPRRSLASSPPLGSRISPRCWRLCWPRGGP